MDQQDKSSPSPYVFAIGARPKSSRKLFHFGASLLLALTAFTTSSSAPDQSPAHPDQFQSSATTVPLSSINHASLAIDRLLAKEFLPHTLSSVPVLGADPGAPVTDSQPSPSEGPRAADLHQDAADLLPSPDEQEELIHDQLGLPTPPATLIWPEKPTQKPTYQVRPIGGNDRQPPLNVIGLGTMQSHEGEELVDFLKRVGRVLHDFTSQTKFEACAAIGERDDHPNRYVAPIVTNGSHIACTPDPSFLTDARDTEQTIHSHPVGDQKGRFTYKVNKVDQQLMRITSGQQRLLHQRHHLINGRNDTFSPQDFAMGAGWLVADGNLLFQDGKDHVVLHGSIAAVGGELYPINANKSNRWISYWHDANIPAFSPDRIPMDHVAVGTPKL